MTDTISLYVKLHHIYFCSCRYFQICFSLLGNNVQAFFLPSLLLQNPLTCSKHEDYLSKLWSACISWRRKRDSRRGQIAKVKHLFLFLALLGNDLESKIYPPMPTSTHTAKNTTGKVQFWRKRIKVSVKALLLLLLHPPAPVCLFLFGVKHQYKMGLFSSFLPKWIASGNQIARSISLGQIL